MKGLMTLYNVYRQKIMQKEIDNQEVIDAIELTEGIYFFTFGQSDGAIFSRKGVKH